MSFCTAAAAHCGSVRAPELEARVISSLSGQWHHDLRLGGLLLAASRYPGTRVARRRVPRVSFKFSQCCLQALSQPEAHWQGVFGVLVVVVLRLGRSGWYHSVICPGHTSTQGCSSHGYD
eukprot:1298531-Rhodomonas_salina.1